MTARDESDDMADVMTSALDRLAAANRRAEAAEARATAAESRVKKLEEALEPFSFIPTIYYGESDEMFGPSVRLKHFRRARAAIRARSEEKTNG